jgi:hypothetical protein
VQLVRNEHKALPRSRFGAPIAVPTRRLRWLPAAGFEELLGSELGGGDADHRVAEAR